MNEIAIRFNPLDKRQITFDMVKTNWKVVDEFYIQTDKGPIMAGEIWKDTAINRAIIDKLIEMKKEFIKFDSDSSIALMKLFHTKEK